MQLKKKNVKCLLIMGYGGLRPPHLLQLVLDDVGPPVGLVLQLVAVQDVIVGGRLQLLGGHGGGEFEHVLALEEGGGHRAAIADKGHQVIHVSNPLSFCSGNIIPYARQLVNYKIVK